MADTCCGSRALYNFAAQNINNLAGRELAPLLLLALPLGISFYTFQMVSYQIDFYRGAIEKPAGFPTERSIFVFYEPEITDSYYYSDAGKVALTTEYPYVKKNTSYFNDSVFLGDSRTLGISDYAGLDEADFYCDNGMMIYKLLEPEGVTCQKTGKKGEHPFCFTKEAIW